MALVSSSAQSEFRRWPSTTWSIRVHLFDTDPTATAKLVISAAETDLARLPLPRPAQRRRRDHGHR